MKVRVETFLYNDDEVNTFELKEDLNYLEAQGKVLEVMTELSKEFEDITFGDFDKNSESYSDCARCFMSNYCYDEDEGFVIFSTLGQFEDGEIKISIYEDLL